MKQGKSLYLPVCSQNFNAIFASESISPPRFYPKRNFGVNQFYLLFENFDDGIVLFEELPYFDIDNNSDFESNLLIFEFFALDEHYLTEIDPGIWLYCNTIYLNQDNFKLYFLDPHIKKVVFVESKMSKTTKTVAKFEKNFSDCKIPNLGLKRYQLPLVKIEETNFEKKVSIDRLFNSFKGFIYCFIVGEISEKSYNEVAFSKSLQNIINCFARYKIELAQISTASKNKSSKQRQKSIYNELKNISVQFELEDALKTSKLLLSHIVSEQKFNHTKWVIDYLQLPREAEDIAIKVLSLIADLIPNLDSVLKREYVKNTNSLMLRFEIVEENISQYKSETIELRQTKDNEIKDFLFEIEKHFKTKLLEQAGKKEISEFEKIDLLVKEKEIILAKTKLNEKDTDNFVKICNVLLKETKDFSRKTNDEDLLIIVEKVWDSFGLSASSTSNPIHKYLSHKSKTIDIEKKTDVMKNFIAFLLNPNNIEQLKTYLEDKKIQNTWISYSFWGLYNGFANISREFTNVILGSDNFILMRSIDNYLNKILRKIEADLEYKKLHFINVKPKLQSLKQIEILDKEKARNTPGLTSAITFEFDLTAEDLDKVLKNLEVEKIKKIQKIIEELNNIEYSKFAPNYRAELLKKEIDKSNSRVKKASNKITNAEIEKILNAYMALNNK